MRQSYSLVVAASTVVVTWPRFVGRYRIVSLYGEYRNDGPADFSPALRVFDEQNQLVSIWRSGPPIPATRDAFVMWAPGQIPSAWDAGSQIHPVPIPDDLWIEVGWTVTIQGWAGSVGWLDGLRMVFSGNAADLVPASKKEGNGGVGWERRGGGWVRS